MPDSVTMMLDPEDRFRAGCAVFSTYPANLLSTHHSRRKIRAYCDTLEEERKRLFQKEGSLKIIEFNNGRRLPDFEARTQAELQAYFQRGIEDPHLRYIAIEAQHSRDPLRCTHDMFTYLSTFHQISPSFIPAICSFGRVMAPKDVCLAFFDASDSLYVSSADKMPIRSLGRSGSEIKLSYLLRVVERSPSQPPWTFIVRPLAVYHSYDLQTRRTFWMTVKGNTTTRDQVCEVLEDSLHPQSAGYMHPFTATLDLHLSLMETVDENWQAYINEVEHIIRKTASKASKAQLDMSLQFETMQITEKKLPQSNDTTTNQGSRMGSFMRSMTGFSSIQKDLSLDHFKPEPTQRNRTTWWRRLLESPDHRKSSQKEVESRDLVAKYLRLDMFYTFEDNQSLHRYGEAIQEAILTIKLDANAMHGLKEFYESKALQDAVFNDVEQPDIHQLQAFIGRLNSLEDSLRVKQQQFESLEAVVKEAKVLYDGVAQYRSMQISKIYAQMAEASAQRMEKVAVTTEKETASMHIITFVTLVFLPGTFIASFLQSGVFQFRDEESLASSWVFRTPVFDMFITICVVMMVITLAVWFVVFRCLRKRSLSQNSYATMVEKDNTKMV